MVSWIYKGRAYFLFPPLPLRLVSGKGGNIRIVRFPKEVAPVTSLPPPYVSRSASQPEATPLPPQLLLSLSIPSSGDVPRQQPEAKPILDVTAEEILRSLLSIGDRIAADDVAKMRYYGKYVRWTGTIMALTPHRDEIDSLSWDVIAPGHPGCNCYVSAALPREKTRYLRIGKRISVLCRIFNIDLHPRDASISLTDCELVEG
jgi:hypothetical protein